MNRKDFSPTIKGARTHANCIEQVKVARPGKTKHGKAHGYIEPTLSAKLRMRIADYTATIAGKATGAPKLDLRKSSGGFHKPGSNK